MKEEQQHEMWDRQLRFVAGVIVIFVAGLIMGQLQWSTTYTPPPNPFHYQSPQLGKPDGANMMLGSAYQNNLTPPLK